MKLLSLISEETNRGEQVVEFTEWIQQKFEGENDEDVNPILELGKKLFKAGFQFEDVVDLQEKAFNLQSDVYSMEVTVAISDDGKIGIRATDGNDMFKWGPVGADKLGDFQIKEFIEAVNNVFSGLNGADHEFHYGSRENVSQNF